MRQPDALLGCILALSFACSGCSSGPRGEGGVIATASTPLAEAPASTGTAQQAVEQVILQNERKVWDAFKARDVNSINALLADEVQVVSADGRFSKSEFLRLVSQFPDIPSYSINKVRVISPSQDVAILTYESRYTTREPRPVTHSAYQTTVWANRGGRWVAVFNQETQIQSR